MLPISIQTTFVLLSFLLGSTHIPPAHAIHPDELLENALSWMTFRRQGKLVPQPEIENDLLQPLRDRYHNSKMYRSFVIAFLHGVLPKLNLQEGHPCNPEYFNKFKNPINNSVTWNGLKKFVFESYKQRNNKSIQYCDYRQGLTCSKQFAACSCRDDAEMSEISPGSPIKRCLLPNGTPCAIPDFHEGLGPSSFNMHLLTETVFNLEKSEGCQNNLQCRFTKRDNPGVAICEQKDQWDLLSGQANHLELDIGSACSLGHLGERTCKKATGEVGSGPGYTCFDFGAPRSLGQDSTSREGFCAHELGSLQIYQESKQVDHGKWTNLWKHNFVMGFVHRRSVHLDQQELKAYYLRYLNEVHRHVFPINEKSEGKQASHVGDRCNDTKTETMKEIWKYFMGIDLGPPEPGGDFAVDADKDDLMNNLDKLVALVNEPGRFCKIYWSFEQKSATDVPMSSPALTCVKVNGTSAIEDANDGKCEDAKDEETKGYAETIQRFSSILWNVTMEEKDEESKVDQTILKDNPEHKRLS